MRHECGGDTVVVEARPSEQGYRRRRRCLACGVKFSTLETVVVFKSPAEGVGAVRTSPVGAKVQRRVEAAKRRTAARRAIEEMEEGRDEDLGGWGGLVGYRRDGDES